VTTSDEIKKVLVVTKSDIDSPRLSGLKNGTSDVTAMEDDTGANDPAVLQLQFANATFYFAYDNVEETFLKDLKNRLNVKVATKLE